MSTTRTGDPLVVVNPTCDILHVNSTRLIQTSTYDILHVNSTRLIQTSTYDILHVNSTRLIQTSTYDIALEFYCYTLKYLN